MSDPKKNKTATMNNWYFTLLFVSCIGFCFPACVGKKKYTALLGEQLLLTEQERQLQARLDNNQAQLAQIIRENNLLENRVDQLEAERNQLEGRVIELRSSVDDISSQAQNEKTRLDTDLQAKSAIVEQQGKILEQAQGRVNTANTRLRNLQFQLFNTLGNVSEDQVSIALDPGHLRIVFFNDYLFTGTSATRLNSGARKTLERVAEALKAYPEMLVEVAVFTGTEKHPSYQDNWQFSAIRATTISRMLAKDYSIGAHRITASGRSEFHPLDTSSGREARHLNHRTVITVRGDYDEVWKALMQPGS